MSGAEPPYNPDKYNNDSAIRHSHNCFAYAFGVIDPLQRKKCADTKDCAVPFHVPGKESGYDRINAKSCAETMIRTLADSDGGYPIGFTGKCRRGFSKIATVVDPDRDFHYYRQDTNGMWSHKPGATPVTNKDSAGNPIYDPDLAGRYYPSEESHKDELDYSGFCGYYCIPRSKALTIAAGGKRSRRGKQRDPSGPGGKRSDPGGKQHASKATRRHRSTTRKTRSHRRRHRASTR